MMEKTFENDYLIFEIEKSKSTFVYTWKSSSRDWGTDNFLVEAQRVLEGILESKCEYIIGNDTNFFFPVVPEIQELINKQMLQQLNNRIKKFTHVTSDELIAQLSVEQLFEENKEATYEDTFVGTLTEALELLSK